MAFSNIDMRVSKYFETCCYLLQQVPSYMLMGIQKEDAVELPLPLSPLAEAISRNDLTAVHEILVKTGYKDDEGTDNEVLFIPFDPAVT